MPSSAPCSGTIPGRMYKWHLGLDKQALRDHMALEARAKKMRSFHYPHHDLVRLARLISLIRLIPRLGINRHRCQKPEY